jgi:hypothetical protein
LVLSHPLACWQRSCESDQCQRHSLPNLTHDVAPLVSARRAHSVRSRFRLSTHWYEHAAGGGARRADKSKQHAGTSYLVHRNIKLL